MNQSVNHIAKQTEKKESHTESETETKHTKTNRNKAFSKALINGLELVTTLDTLECHPSGKREHGNK